MNHLRSIKKSNNLSLSFHSPVIHFSKITDEASFLFIIIFLWMETKRLLLRLLLQSRYLPPSPPPHLVIEHLQLPVALLQLRQLHQQLTAKVQVDEARGAELGHPRLLCTQAVEALCKGPDGKADAALVDSSSDRTRLLARFCTRRRSLGKMGLKPTYGRKCCWQTNYSHVPYNRPFQGKYGFRL